MAVACVGTRWSGSRPCARWTSGCVTAPGSTMARRWSAAACRRSPATCTATSSCRCAGGSDLRSRAPGPQLHLPAIWIHRMRSPLLALLLCLSVAGKAQLNNWDPSWYVTDTALVFHDDLDYYLNGYSTAEIKA